MWPFFNFIRFGLFPVFSYYDYTIMNVSDPYILVNKGTHFSWLHTQSRSAGLIKIVNVSCDAVRWFPKVTWIYIPTSTTRVSNTLLFLICSYILNTIVLVPTISLFYDLFYPTIKKATILVRLNFPSVWETSLRISFRCARHEVSQYLLSKELSWFHFIWKDNFYMFRNSR